jgi:hypothetical protein
MSPVPVAYSHVCSNGDLHVVNVVPIPDRLENRVCQAEDQYVLDGLLARVMVGAVDLRFGENPMDDLAELPRGQLVGSERFFDHDAPIAARFVRQTALAEVGDRWRVEPWCGCKVEDTRTVPTWFAAVQETFQGSDLFELAEVTAERGRRADLGKP